MKYIVFCLGLCLLMISCSSTPPAESQEDLAPTASILGDVVQSEENITPEEQDTQDLEEVSPEDISFQVFPTEEFLELKEDDLEDVAPLEETKYLQEIEIIDIDQQQDHFMDDLENMAMVMDEPENMVVEPEMALVVETPADELVEPIPEQLPKSDDEVALVVEEVVDATVPDAGELESLPELSLEQETPDESLSEVESQAVELIMEDESLLVEAEDAAVPEIVPQEQEEEQSELQLEELVPGEVVPIDINAVQGVVTPVEPSRTVVMDNQQFLDLRYPGNGWVYLGEVSAEGASIGTPSLTYFGRRCTSNDTNFTLRSIKPGSTILHFYKQDVLTATFIDDFVQVTITDKEAQVGSRVIAPNYGSVIPGYQDTVPQPSNYVQAEPAQEILAAAEPELSNVSEPEVSPSKVPEPIAPSTTDTVGPATTADTVTAQASRGESRPENAGVTATPLDTGTVAAVTEQQVPDIDTIVNQRAEMQAPATGADRNATNQPQTDTVQNQVGALQVVPPQDSNITSPSPTEPQSQPEVSAVRQQEVYQPETSSPVAATSSDYNPQTGMSMENLQLPWVQEELERQRTADIQATDTTSDTQPPVLDQLEEQDALLAKAQECFYAEDYPASLDYLNQFFSIAVSDFDAAYYLKGQVLESKSSIRNIKEAQKAYKHVVDSYPQSPFWKRAKNRFTYLSRFYFDIR